MRARRLAVVILNWNGREDTLSCLSTLDADVRRGVRVVVVDNGSKDRSASAVRRLFPRVKVIQNGENLGYAGGNNAGLRWALASGYEWVLLLNNDTIPPRTMIADLMEYATEHPELGAIQPLLVSAANRGRVDSAGHYLHRCPGIVDLLMEQPISTVPSRPTPVFGACGAAALLRVSALQKVGLLDEDLFVLAEDVDLMFRLRLAGEDVHLLPSVRVAHKRGVSGGSADPEAARRRKFWLQRNSLALALSYWPLKWLILSSPLLALRAVHALVLSLGMSGQRCWPLWSQRMAGRAANRHAMRRLDLDRWFGLNPTAE